jgi:hypothetical protein
MAKIFCFIPAFGKMISAATFETSHHLAMALISKGHHFNVGTYSWPDIEQMRNIVLGFWYDVMPESEYLLFVDSDMGFEPQVVLDMMAFGEAVVGAVYPKRTYPIEWCVSGLPPDQREVRGEFYEVEGLGGGCLLIHRDAITTMIEAFPDLVGNYMALEDMKKAGATRTLNFFNKIQTDRGPVSEDISFCRRWRSIGGKVWGACGHEITHVGQHPFTAGYLSHNAAVEQRNRSEAQRNAPTSMRARLLENAEKIGPFALATELAKLNGDDQSAA